MVHPGQPFQVASGEDRSDTVLWKGDGDEAGNKEYEVMANIQAGPPARSPFDSWPHLE